jgi:prepilin-type N-terminal cleavage/methylation domain-containing protein
MTFHNKKLAGGFTLVETVVTIFVFSIIMLGATLLMQNIIKNSTQQSLTLDTVDQARTIIFNFTNELRNATAGNDGSYPLGLASDSQITFYSTYGVANSTQINKVRYYVTGTTLYKGVTAPSGSPLSYNGTERVTTLMTKLGNAGTPVFYYYDGNYAGTSTPLIQPININNVKFAAMNLILPTQDSRGATTTFAITAGGTIRNLKNNLGN